MKPEAEIILKRFKADRQLAFDVLFTHRHSDKTPPFHKVMRQLWASGRPQVIIEAFRGAAKSTTLEEDACVVALFQEARNILIVGENEARAIDRLRSIKFELETNERILALFGNQVGKTWQETKIVLANGVVVQALGKGQSLRGVKHLAQRPDYLLIDDLEDEELVATPAARDKLAKWFYGSLIPAMAKIYRVRMAATPLDPESLAEKLAMQPAWKMRRFPIEFIDVNGRRRATWEARFPLSWIDAKKAELYGAGQGQVWMQEYMCKAVDPADRVFTDGMFKFDASMPRSWHAVYAVYDPARTTAKRSDFTGVAVGSWMGNRLIVWRAEAHKWMPNEMIADMFETDLTFEPVAIGVEKTGLDEWVLQPLRQAQVEKQTLLPLRELRPPKGKIEFIKGLQPYFRAREVIFAGTRDDFAAAIQQFLSFPTGHDDIPNALAYLLKMRPGLPVFDGFGVAHLSDGLDLAPRVQITLAVNAGCGVTTGVLVQVNNGVVMVHADWCVDADPGQALAGIVAAAGAYAKRKIAVIAPADQFQLASTGMTAAARMIPINLSRGGDITDGREYIRKAMDTQIRGMPGLRIGHAATWTRRGFAGGYALKEGQMQANDNLYRALMEGLEAFVATLGSGLARDEGEVHYAHDPRTGRRFISARQ